MEKKVIGSPTNEHPYQSKLDTLEIIKSLWNQAFNGELWEHFMTDHEPPRSSMILYQTEDGRTRIQCRFEDETVWLTQALMAELFQIGVNTVNHHLKEIYDDCELQREATIRYYRIVRLEGSREVSREIEHYSLPVILAVGYRVRSHRGVQFRQWATAPWSTPNRGWWTPILKRWRNNYGNRGQ